MKYRIVGSTKGGWAVVAKQDGAVLYDLLKTRREAREIRDVLDCGIGPDWAAVEVELRQRAAAVAAEKADRRRKAVQP